MSHYSELDIAHHTRMTCPNLPVDRPNAIDHLQNAINHIELFVLPDATDAISLRYVLLQLYLAIVKIERETNE